MIAKVIMGLTPSCLQSRRLMDRTGNGHGCRSAFAFATSKRSFYAILDIEDTFTTRELRKKYLIKARKYHPDHNHEPGALQEFKLVKEAYETLKNAQKRHMYDSGMAEMPDEVTPVYDKEVRQGRMYYHNKWHGFKKPNDHDMRDEYYKMKTDYFADKPVSQARYILPFTAIVLALFGYDFLSRLDTDKDKEKQQARKVLQNANLLPQSQTKQERLMGKYMEKRQKLHKVDM